MSPPDTAAAAAAAPVTSASATAEVARVAQHPAARAGTPAYRRILLKLSGEALMGESSYGIERATIDRIVAEVADVVRLGVQVAVVIGGGTSSAAWRRARRGWTAPPRTTWGCSRRS
jgi:hypothetical protein